MRLAFDRTNCLKHVLGGMTLIGVLGLLPAGLVAEGCYLSYVGMGALLSGWGFARVVNYQKEKTKMELKENLSLEKPIEAGSTSLIRVSQALSLVRGYSGVTASFAASAFPPSEAVLAVKISGTLAISSIYIESILETVRLKQELRFKKSILIQADKDSRNELSHNQSNISVLNKFAIPKRFFMGCAILFIPSAIIINYIPNSPDQLFPIFIILGSLSILFANRLNNMQIRDSLNSTSLLISSSNAASALPDVDNPVISKVGCYDAKKMSKLISYSATLRGIIGTVLTVGTYFALFPISGLRALGLTILTMNFMESILEYRNLDLEIQEFDSFRLPQP